jgi:transposase
MPGHSRYRASPSVVDPLAKSLFQIHGVDERGKALLRKQLKRSEVLKFFANLPACLIGMQVCGSAHYWARKLIEFGHTVKLMAPSFVKPYVKTNKNDRNDAEAICEAVTRPNMRFVPVKSAEQQGLLALHCARSGWVKARTAQANQVGKRGDRGEHALRRTAIVASTQMRLQGCGMSNELGAVICRFFRVTKKDGALWRDRGVVGLTYPVLRKNAIW